MAADETQSGNAAKRQEYIVVFFDRYDDESISFVLGPYDTLQDTHAAVRRAMEKMGGGYRRYSISECKSLSLIPEWELVS